VRFFNTAGKTARSLNKASLPSGLRRQIMMGNRLSIFAACVTLAYIVFYVCYDFSIYWPLVAMNIVFLGGYLAVPCLNRRGHLYAARNLVLGNVIVQVFVATYLTSSGSGLHLFYLTVTLILPLMFHRYRVSTLIGMGCLVAVLFVICELVFAPSMDVSPLELPASLMQMFYITSAVGSITLTGMFAYLFRVEIDRMENELTESNRNLEELSTTDSLTGLVNRRGLDVFLGQEWARMQRDHSSLAVLICDVDYFKTYNDYYGHAAGDVALQHIAEALTQVARRPADLVARYGGEELVLVLPETVLEDARLMGEAVREAVEEIGLVHERSKIGPLVTISVGVSAATPERHLSPAHLFRAADEALYAAKAGGRNRVSVAHTARTVSLAGV
jgi:diguanylate cyclase (GGDEF)-like protein